MAKSPSTVLYYFTAAYFSKTVIDAFNAQFGTSFTSSDFQINKIPNLQNSRCAYEFFPVAPGSLMRIRIYCQLGDSFKLSAFSIQDVNGGYTDTNATLTDGVERETVQVSFGSNIQATAPEIKSIFKADFFLAQKAYSEYVANYSNGCPPYDEYGSEVWLLSNPDTNTIITDDQGNCLVMKQS